MEIYIATAAAISRHKMKKKTNNNNKRESSRIVDYDSGHDGGGRKRLC